MRRTMFCLVVACALLIGGCVVAEKAAGIHRDPVTGEPSSDGTGGIAGNLLNILIPGAGAVVAAAAAAYANAKRSQWKNAAMSTFEAIEAFKKTAQGEKVWDDLKGKLGEAHATAEVTKIVEKALGNT